MTNYAGTSYSKALALAAIAQGLLYIITGLWPILSMNTFIAVTGHKTDLWLVKTSGILITVVGCILLMAGVRKNLTVEIRMLAIGFALALAGVDVIYVSEHVILPVYLLDAAGELFLAAWWGIAWSLAGRAAN